LTFAARTRPIGAMKTTPALRISLGPSRSAAVLICFALVTSIGAHAILTMRHWSTRSASHAIIGVELDADRAVRLTERTGRRIEGMVQPDSYVGALLTTLVVRPDGKRRLRTIAILPDMLPADDFRRLRLLLRLGHGSTTAADS
jgi:hypothetical protein